MNRPFTAVLWTDSCEQHIVQVNAPSPVVAALIARVSHARMERCPIVEVEVVCVVPGHGAVYGEDDLQPANLYCDEEDEDEDGEEGCNAPA
ncbi:hypothetical protein [Belnapia moabensis]|uniref:hypothetical protein n=1 Tax=Belnapia moabensis TaxID=365533 RepID=UPI0005BE2CFF|nr:hypothetical protein [Belnapia moabensis]